MKSPCAFISLVFILAVTACGPQPAQPTPTVEAQPKLTESPSATTAPATATDSATNLPEPAPSAIPTYPPLATLTPALAAGGPGAYRLAPQTADQADESIARIEQKILGLEDEPYPPDSPGWRPHYGPYYLAAWYAAWNAFARFPNDPRAEAWRSKMAYYMALAGDGDDAAQIYMDQITAALNSGQTQAGNLENWFQSGHLEKTLYTPVFTLTKQPVSLPNTQGGYLITIGKLDSVNTPGGMCLLVVKKAEKYVAYKLYNGFSSGGYDWLIRNPVTCSLKDVTDDGVDEIIIEQYSGAHFGSDTIEIYNVTSLPPKIMPFTSSQKENLDIWNGGIQDYPVSNGQTNIQTLDPVGDLNCDNHYTRDYQWNGKWFDLRNEAFHFGIPSGSNPAFCVDMALNDLNTLDEKDAVNFLDAAIQAYRPHAGEMGDVFNELIVHKAAYEALSGKADQARSTLNEFVQLPGAKDSIWLEPAQKFLAIYQQPADLYRACSVLTACAPYRGNPTDNSLSCVEASLCDSTSALDHVLSAEYSSLALAELPAKLKEIGVDIKAEGWLDFNQDHQNELWFTVYNPQYKDTDLWIGVETATKGNIVFGAGPYEPAADRPSFHLETMPSGQIRVDFGGDQLFELTRDPATGAPTLDWTDPLNSKEPTDEEIQAINNDLEKFLQLRQQLLLGSAPLPIYNQMVEIDRKYPNCPFENST
ncbi:MAG: hypothetical protein WA821_11140, partial [Anaerolineales bacterium]